MAGVGGLLLPKMKDEGLPHCAVFVGIVLCVSQRQQVAELVLVCFAIPWLPSAVAFLRQDHF
jgi:hypothetical protein